MFTSTDWISWGKHFYKNNNGNVAVMFALVFVPMLVAGGAAIDIARYANNRAALQAALDSGTLSAATSNLNTEERKKMGEDMFDRNIAQSSLKNDDISRNFIVNKILVKATATEKIPTSFMKLVGIKDMKLSVSSEVTIPSKASAEIVMVLDYSLSMRDPLRGEKKFITMRKAARGLVDDLSQANPEKVKFGLVPFSDRVQLSMPAKYIAGMGTEGQWSGCVSDRAYPYNLTSATPDPNDETTKWSSSPNRCFDYVDRALTIAPLTNKFGDITDQLDAMIPVSNTHIALGAEFGYHLLTDNSPFDEAVPYNKKDVKKVMILLTDGMQTTDANGPGNRRSDKQGEKNLETLCQNMKADGITIYTIAFNLSDKSTRNRLANCSSDRARNFFDAGDNASLLNAFSEIRNSVTGEIFVSG